MKKKTLRIISLAVCAAVLTSSTISGYAAPISVSENSNAISEETIEEIRVEESKQDIDSEKNVHEILEGQQEEIDEHIGQDCEEIFDEEYQVLERDEQSRETLVQTGDLYVTTIYDDENRLYTVYYANAPYEEGNIFIEKITVQEIDGNEFGSTCIVTVENEQGITIDEYNEFNQVTRTVSTDGECKVNYYNGENLIKEIVPYTGTEEDIMHTTSYSYDSNGHLSEIRVPVDCAEDGTISYSIARYEYNNNDDLCAFEQSVNETGKTEQFARTEYEYDEGGNKTKTIEYDTDGSVISIAQFYYDEDGNLLRQYTGLNDSLTINGLDCVVPGKDKEYAVVQYEYDEGRMVSMTDAEGNKETYEYGEDGLLSVMTDKNGNRHEYTYNDGLYRESEKIYYAGNNSDTPDSERTYIQETDANGNEDMLTAIEEDGKRVSYTYDAEGQMLTETDPNGNQVSYTYNDIGQITSITVNDENGRIIGATKYQYDASKKLKAIKDKDGKTISEYAYNKKGKVSKKKLKNGSTISYTYNEAGWKTDIKAKDKTGKVIEDKSYVYTVDGNVASEKDRKHKTNIRYEYDGTGRLLKEKSTGEKKRNVDFSYDEAGNRTKIKDGKKTQFSVYDDANRLVSSGDNEIVYDAGGNMLSDGKTTYTYDARNHLISAVSEEADVRYEYDINGRVIKRILNGKEETFVWANDAIVAKLSEEGNTYYYDEPDNEIIAADISGQNQYYVEDNHGNIIASLDEKGSVKESNTYDAFGNADLRSGEMEPGYTGNFYDGTTGLLYLNARFYNPETGTFLTEDSIAGSAAETITLNRYAYCKQNPVNYTDDSGHWSSADHTTQTTYALNAYSYSGTAKTCMEYAQGITDSNFHYETDVYRLSLSDKSISRMNLSNLVGYCDQSRVNLNSMTKDNYYRSLYHGRGDYYKYIAYMLGIALQFQKGYQITQVTLRNDDWTYQQINFDMLIHLPGKYEKEKKGSTVSRAEISYLIMGIAMHLSEDLWAHTAIANDTSAELSNYSGSFVNFTEVVNDIANSNKPVSYLGLGQYKKSSANIENTIVEGNTRSGNERRGYAKEAAKRLLYYYKNGRIMYSGSQTLSGTDSATSADRALLNKLVCSNATLSSVQYQVVSTGKTVRCGRYSCTSCNSGSSDSCYRLFYSALSNNKGLGFNRLLRYNVADSE